MQYSIKPAREYDTRNHLTPLNDIVYVSPTSRGIYPELSLSVAYENAVPLEPVCIFTLILPVYVALPGKNGRIIGLVL